MNSCKDVDRLLADRVPLTLLFDIAGFGPSSTELLIEEAADAELEEMLVRQRAAASSLTANFVIDVRASIA